MLFFSVMVRDYFDRFADAGLVRSLYPEMKATIQIQPVDGEGLIAHIYKKRHRKTGME